MTDFDKNECNSIKFIAVNGNTKIDATLRFIKGKNADVFKSLVV